MQVSRTGIVRGHAPFKPADEEHGRKRGGREPAKANGRREDVWFDVESFMMDHIGEVLSKLEDGSMDDEIWGKIVLMEEGRRLAKAYLRKTSIIVDGGDEEFDGETLGFNHFRSARSDSNEFRAKIGEGVILQMDAQGNLKAMARGSAPVYVQGCRDTKHTFAADSLVRVQGKLNQVDANGKEIVFKVFEMKKFKKALQTLERDGNEAGAKQRSLLLRTCVRIALVKDGNSSDPHRTPCWLAVVNVVALEMLKEQIQQLGSLSPSIPSIPPTPLIPPAYGPQELAHLFMAAMQHSPQIASNFGMSSFASLANSLSAASPLAVAQTAAHAKPPLSRRSSRRPPQRSAVSSDESEGENEVERASRFSESSVSKLSDSISSASAESERPSPPFRSSPDFSSKKSQRPRLDQFVAQFNGQSDVASSGYDSPRDLFDSGSWSSGADTRCSEESPQVVQIEETTPEHHDASEEAAVPDYSIYAWVNKTLVEDDAPLPSPPPPLSHRSAAFDSQFSVRSKSRPPAVRSAAPPKSSTSTRCCLRGIQTGPLVMPPAADPPSSRPPSRLRCWLRRERSIDTTTSTRSPASTNWWMEEAMRSPIMHNGSLDSGNFERVLLETDRQPPPLPPPHGQLAPVRPTARPQRALPPRHVNVSDSGVSRIARPAAHARSVSALPRHVRAEPRARSPSGQLSRLIHRLHPPVRHPDCEASSSWRRQF